MHRDDVHIALTEDEVLLPRLLRIAETEEISRLIEKPGLRAVQVLRLSLPHHTTAEADDTAVDIHDREDDAIKELIVRAPFGEVHETRLTEDRVLVAALAEIAVEPVPGLIGIAEAPDAERFVAQLTLPEVVHTDLSDRLPERIIKVDSRLFIDLEQLRPEVTALPLLTADIPLRKLVAYFIGELPHRLQEGEVLILHCELYDIAALSASEAVENLLRLIHGKGGRLLSMKRAEPEIIGAHLFQMDDLTDHVHDIGP